MVSPCSRPGSSSSRFSPIGHCRWQTGGRSLWRCQFTSGRMHAPRLGTRWREAPPSLPPASKAAKSNLQTKDPIGPWAAHPGPRVASPIGRGPNLSVHLLAADLARNHHRVRDRSSLDRPIQHGPRSMSHQHRGFRCGFCAVALPLAGRWSDTDTRQRIHDSCNMSCVLGTQPILQICDKHTASLLPGPQRRQTRSRITLFFIGIDHDPRPRMCTHIIGAGRTVYLCTVRLEFYFSHCGTIKHACYSYTCSSRQLGGLACADPSPPTNHQLPSDSTVT